MTPLHGKTTPHPSPLSAVGSFLFSHSFPNRTTPATEQARGQPRLNKMAADTAPLSPREAGMGAGRRAGLGHTVTRGSAAALPVGCAVHLGITFGSSAKGSRGVGGPLLEDWCLLLFLSQAQGPSLSRRYGDASGQASQRECFPERSGWGAALPGRALAW